MNKTRGKLALVLVCTLLMGTLTGCSAIKAQIRSWFVAEEQTQTVEKPVSKPVEIDEGQRRLATAQWYEVTNAEQALELSGVPIFLPTVLDGYALTSYRATKDILEVSYGNNDILMRKGNGPYDISGLDLSQYEVTRGFQTMDFLAWLYGSNRDAISYAYTQIGDDFYCILLKEEWTNSNMERLLSYLAEINLRPEYDNDGMLVIPLFNREFVPALSQTTDDAPVGAETQEETEIEEGTFGNSNGGTNG